MADLAALLDEFLVEAVELLVGRDQIAGREQANGADGKRIDF